MAINRYTTFETINSADTSNILEHEVITGNTSTAVGVVITKTATVLNVGVISGNFTPTGETVTNQDLDTCVGTSTVAWSSGQPTAMVIVTGDNTASTTIFRDVRDASNTGGWGIHTDPSATDYKLTLDCMLYFGRADEATAQTKVVSEKEKPLHFDKII